MWVKPRQTIRAIINYNCNHRFILLSFLYGFLECLQTAQGFSLSMHFSFGIILALCLILAIPFGVISFYITTLFVYWTGRLVKGQGTFKQIKASVAWSNVTTIISFVFAIILLALFGSAIFDRSFYDGVYPLIPTIVLSLALLCEMVLSVWRLVIFILALSEVQKFSGWMSLLNVVLASILGIILYFLFDMLLAVISRSFIMQ